MHALTFHRLCFICIANSATLQPLKSEYIIQVISDRIPSTRRKTKIGEGKRIKLIDLHPHLCNRKKQGIPAGVNFVAIEKQYKTSSPIRPNSRSSWSNSILLIHYIRRKKYWPNLLADLDKERKAGVKEMNNNNIIPLKAPKLDIHNQIHIILLYVV